MVAKRLRALTHVANENLNFSELTNSKYSFFLIKMKFITWFYQKLRKDIVYLLRSFIIIIIVFLDELASQKIRQLYMCFWKQEKISFSCIFIVKFILERKNSRLGSNNWLAYIISSKMYKIFYFIFKFNF